MRGSELVASAPVQSGRPLQTTSLAYLEGSAGSDAHARTAVDKAFELLAAFPGGGATAGVTELARDLALTKSTVFRLLGAMERNGFVERQGNRYRLGCRLHNIGARVYETEPGRLHELLAPSMALLYEGSHETINLGVLRGGEVVLLGRLHGSRPTATGIRLGSRFPAHSSALGKALLAHDPDMADRLLVRGLRPRTPRTIVHPDHFRDELEHVRERGIATSVQEARANLSCVAVPLLDDADRPLAALAISAPSTAFNAGRHERLLRQAAVEAKRALRRHPLAVVADTGPYTAPWISQRGDEVGVAAT
jgi:DNA-binding IclR family transcriptional regulator